MRLVNIDELVIEELLVMDRDYVDEFASGVRKVMNALRRLPIVDAVPVVHGKWERVIPSKSAAKWSTKVSCSICHRHGYTYHKYCPNCGAKMIGGEKNGTN